MPNVITSHMKTTLKPTLLPRNNSKIYHSYQANSFCTLIKSLPIETLHEFGERTEPYVNLGELANRRGLLQIYSFTQMVVILNPRNVPVSEMTNERTVWKTWTREPLVTCVKIGWRVVALLSSNLVNNDPWEMGYRLVTQKVEVLPPPTVM